jgi:methylmalonyl-CoA/ethylmalonyl-CoA epimerase
MTRSSEGPVSVFRHVKQICVVVRDLDEAVRRYSSRYGFGPWYLFTYRDISGLVRGRQQTFSVRTALTKIDDVFQWELLQPLDEASIYAEFLREHGEGVQHVAFDVDSVPDTAARLGSIIRADIAGKYGGTQRYAMLDTEGDLGVLAEVMDYTDDWVRPGADGMYPPPENGRIPELRY